MKKRMNWKTIKTFSCGAMSSLLLCGGVTGALAAASGTVSFNVTEVTLDSEKVFPKNKDLRMEDGTMIPSTILYTDENGNGTTYIPIRVLTETLHMDTTWLAELNRLRVDLSGDQALYMLGTDDAGSEWTGLVKEVEPVKPTSGKTLVQEKLSGREDAFGYEFKDLNLSDGEFISVTVTNVGHFPLQFDLGFGLSDTMTSSVTQIPVGTTVTRTVKLLSEENLKKQPLTVKIGNAEGTAHSIKADISAIQFKGAK